jgi:hypothetical protein
MKESEDKNVAGGSLQLQVLVRCQLVMYRIVFY